MTVAIRKDAKGTNHASLLVCAFICLFVGNLDRLDTFKAGLAGFEEKIREAEAVVADAKATVASLRELAVATASAQVDLLAGAGRIGSASPARKDQLKTELLEHLKSIGLDNEQLARVDGADRYWVMSDYVIGILQPLNASDDPSKIQAYANAYQSPTPLTPDECEKILIQFKIDNQDTKELMKDYRFYYETSRQRRPEIWHQRKW